MCFERECAFKFERCHFIQINFRPAVRLLTRGGASGRTSWGLIDGVGLVLHRVIEFLLGSGRLLTLEGVVNILGGSFSLGVVVVARHSWS